VAEIPALILRRLIHAGYLIVKGPETNGKRQGAEAAITDE